MVASPNALVYGPDGLIGSVSPEATPTAGKVVLLLTNGGSAVLAKDALRPRADGGFELSAETAHAIQGRGAGGAIGDIRPGQTVIIPVVREQVVVDKRVREAGKVVVHVEPREREEVVDLPLVEEHVDVQRVPVNRFAEGQVEVRQEGDVTIVPVLEEVLVVEKRLMIREEVRITRRKVTTRRTERVMLRGEDVEVLRSPAADSIDSGHSGQAGA